MMVGRRIDNLFPKTDVADRRAGARGARSRAPADDQGRQPHRARGRDRRPCGTRRLGPQRTRADAVWNHAGGVGRDPARRARASRIDSAESARAQGASPMSRKIAASQGLVRRDERLAQLFARRAWRAVARRLHRPRAPSGAWRRRASSASASRQVRSTRSQAASPAAISRRSCSANGSPTIRSCSFSTSRRAASTSAPRPRFIA